MCDCNEGRIYQIGMGCCTPVLGPIENYYTKGQVDELIENIEVSACCITEEEVDEKIAEAVSGKQDTLSAGTNIIISGNVISASGCDLTNYYTKEESDAKYLTEHQHLKTVNNQSLVGDGNITISGDCDLSDYYTKEQVDAKIPSLSGYATEEWVQEQGYITYADIPSYDGVASKQWVINQNYAFNTEVIQYITNLQQQIDYLRTQISGCCTESGETITRWITMTGVDDYTCSGTTKMTKEKEQSSTDGGNTWTDTGNYRTGSTVLEVNSTDCGYSSPLKYTATYSGGNVVSGTCDEWDVISQGEINLENLVNVEIGDCCSIVNGGSFADCQTLSSVTIGSNVFRIALNSFEGCSGLTTCTILGNSLKEIQTDAFRGCTSLTSIDIPSSIKEINSSAFYNCTSLNSITVRATIPPKNVNRYTFANTNCPIYVPSGTVSTYKKASGWSEYADRITVIQ